MMTDEEYEKYGKRLMAFEEQWITLAMGGGRDLDKAILDISSLLENPDDDIALYGILRSPLFGFPDEKLARLHSEEQSLWDTLQTAESDLGDVARLLGEWRQLAAVNDLVSAETTSGSAFYLAAWQNDEPNTVQDRLERISSTARKIIEPMSES